MPTVSRILEIAPIAQYLAANRVAKGSVFGNQAIDPKLPITIYMIRKILQKVYDYDPNYTGVRVVADYLYELIQRDAFRAAAIKDNNTGGQVVVPTSNVDSAPNDIDFIVSASTVIATGDTTVLFDGTGGRPDLRGYNINFFRGGITQYTTPQQFDGSYYGWNKFTGRFSLFPAASVDEPFRISPRMSGLITTASSVNTPDTIILSADGTYSIPSGYFVWRISILPSAADTVRIGTTLGGDEVMFDKVMSTGTYTNNGVTADVYGATVYFTGFTAAATINIYLLPI